MVDMSREMVESRFIELTLSAPLQRTNPFITAGHSEGNGHAAPGMPASYTNICDSEPALSHTLPGRPLPNFLCSTKLYL